MNNIDHYKQAISAKGFTVIEGIYNADEIAAILVEISRANSDKTTFRKTGDLFAIRQFLKEIPA
jgi:hypothetical protein